MIYLYLGMHAWFFNTNKSFFVCINDFLVFINHFSINKSFSSIFGALVDHGGIRGN